MVASFISSQGKMPRRNSSALSTKKTPTDWNPQATLKCGHGIYCVEFDVQRGDGKASYCGLCFDQPSLPPPSLKKETSKSDPLPWRREINFAVSRYGFLAPASMEKEELRHELIVILLTKAQDHPQLVGSKYVNVGAFDRLALQIAKNHIIELRDKSRKTLRIKGEDFLVEMVPFYDATVLAQGKPQRLVQWSSSGENASSAASNHNKIPAGDPILIDKSVPDAERELLSSEELVQFKQVFKRLNPNQRQTVVMAYFRKHTDEEQIELLARYGMQDRLGLTEGGWEHRWARTLSEIKRLFRQEAFIARARAKFRRRNYFSEYQSTWLKEYGRLRARDFLSKFAGGCELLALEELSATKGVLLGKRAELFNEEIIRKADEIKTRHFLLDPFEGRAAMPAWEAHVRPWSDEKKNRGQSTKYTEIPSANTLYNFWTVLCCRKCHEGNLGYMKSLERPPIRLSGGSCPLHHAECTTIENSGLIEIYDFIKKARIYKPDELLTEWERIVLKTDLRVNLPIPCICQSQTVLTYLCRECCTYEHHKCFMTDCKARRAEGFSYCERHLFGLSKLTKEVLQMDITEGIWSPRWTDKTSERLSKRFLGGVSDNGGLSRVKDATRA